MVVINRTKDLPPDFHILIQHSTQECFVFVRRMEEEWTSGKNRFDRSGEFLMIATDQDRTVGICGVNVDPYTDSSSVARLRHLYVLPTCRSADIGTRIVKRCLNELSDQFDTIRLRVPNVETGRFYEKLGFISSDETGASHVLKIR